jgi:hypothetical protein
MIRRRRACCWHFCRRLREELMVHEGSRRNARRPHCKRQCCRRNSRSSCAWAPRSVAGGVRRYGLVAARADTAAVSPGAHVCEIQHLLHRRPPATRDAASVGAAERGRSTTMPGLRRDADGERALRRARCGETQDARVHNVDGARRGSQCRIPARGRHGNRTGLGGTTGRANHDDQLRRAR